MRYYLEAKLSEYGDKLSYQREALALLRTRGRHRPLVERVEEVCGGIETLLHQTSSALGAGLPQIFPRLQVNLVRLRARFELLDEWYMPALLQEGRAEERICDVISRILGELGGPALPDKVVSFTRALSMFAQIKDHPIFFMPACIQSNLLDWIGLYHEIGHAVYQQAPALGRRLGDEVLGYCQEQLQQAPALTTTQLNERFERIRLTLSYWNTYRLEELFCDIFATTVTGPAHLYSWVDVSLTSPYGPYSVNAADPHPPNAARTDACMLALDEGYANHPLKVTINNLWTSFLDQRPKGSLFKQLCPFQLILRLVGAAKEEISKLGYIPYTKVLPIPPHSLSPTNTESVQELVNIGVVNFLLAPREFSGWQKKVAAQIVGST